MDGMTRDTSKRLTAAQFKKAQKLIEEASLSKPGRAPSPEYIRIAKKVLVDGHSRVDVAKQYEVTRQYVDKVANRCYEIYLTMVAGFPNDWQSVVVTGSPKFIKDVKKLERKEHADYAKNQHEAHKE